MKKGVFIIIAVTIIAVVFYGVRYVRTPVDVIIAKAETKEVIIAADGMIAYDEVVCNSPVSGTFYSRTAEGERVGKDKYIANVYDGIVDKELLQSLYNVDRKINEIENSGKESIYVSDEQTSESIIETVKNDIIDDVTEGDVSKIREYKKKLNVVTGGEEKDYSSDSLQKLKKEKREIEKEIKHDSTEMFSVMSGIYTTALDGLEGKILPENIKEYTVEDYRKLDEPKEEIMGNRTVQAGEPACKIVDNYEWYFMTVLSKEQCETIEIGDSVKLRVKELPGIDVDAKIEHISTESEDADEYLVSLKSERYLEGIFNIRKSKVDIILESYYGYEIPIYSIHVKDGKKYVMVQGSIQPIYKECEILSRDDSTGMAIVKPVGDKSTLADGDKIIIGEK